MKVLVQSTYDCSPDQAWAEVQTSRLLLEIMWPLLRFVPLPGESFPPRWKEGVTVRGRAYALWFIPLGVHALRFESIDPSRREIQTREHSPLVRRWDHLISVHDAPGNRTRYSDEIEISAGPLTWLVWLYAGWFYRHRQRRWRRVARRLRACKRPSKQSIRGSLTAGQ